MTQTEKEKKALQLLNDLHGVHQNNEVYVEDLHEMFLALALDGEFTYKDQAANSYLALRNFLRESQKLFQERTELSKKVSAQQP